jgi:hypothetical protein
MRVAGLWLLIGCGRAAFDPLSDAAPPTPDARVLPDGLVAWYPMDVVADGRMSDQAGPHDGACAPGACPALTAPGQIGAAYVFDGDNDIVRIPSVAALETTGGFTVAAWVFRAISGDGSCIFNKGYGEISDNSWQACISDDAMLSFYSASETGPHQQISGPLERERWYHVALWWDGTTKATYVDGTQTAAEFAIPIAFDDRPITLGADIDNAALVLAFRGQIDDLRVYNRALTPAELSVLSERSDLRSTAPTPRRAVPEARD